jgi:hypothetical protein
MAGFPATPFINVLSPLRLKSKTDDWDLPNPRATARRRNTAALSHQFAGFRRGHKAETSHRQ